MAYKFNFNDMSRFIDDFSYLIQKGGTNKFFDKIKTFKNKNIIQLIIKWVVIFFQSVLIIIVIYTLYIIIFRGYPRIFINLLTFKFSNKEKLDDFLKEKNILINQFKFLSSKYESCLTPYSIYQFLYGPTNLYTISQKFEQQVNQYYDKYKYDDKYNNAIKEYYLFFNKINIINPHDIWNKTTKININNYDFYELLLTYRIEQNEILIANPEGGKKSEDQLIYELYKNEELKKFITYKGIFTIHTTFKEIGTEIDLMNKQFIKMPIIPYLIIPENDKSINDIITDFIKYKIYIENKTIYTIPYSQINDHSWYIIEYILSINDTNQYNTFIKNMPIYKNEDMNHIIYYINLPRKEKIVAEQRIMNLKNQDFFEYVKRRPIFAHIYFSRNIINKNVLYAKIMDTYKLLSDCDLKHIKYDINQETMKKRLLNLQNNGFLMKQLVNTVGYLHLFLNIYQHDLTVMYEKQIMSNTRFLKELWTPFLNDIVINRIGNDFKKTFGKEEWNSSLTKFKKYYKILGVHLNTMIKAVFKAFFTSVPIEHPTETNTDDGVHNEEDDEKP